MKILYSTFGFIHNSLLTICLVCLTGQPLAAEVYEVPLIDSETRSKFVEVNVDGIQERFAFDTGCSGLSINIRLAHELARQGKIRLADMHEQTEATLANGATHTVRTLIIKQIEIGGCTFRNVVAMVGTNDAPDAPLLIGQSVLERMRWYRIEGLKLQFEPYDETYQQVLSMAEFYYDDPKHAPALAEQLAPYYNEGRLSCFYACKYLSVLQKTEDYASGLQVLEHIRQSGCKIDDDDLTVVETQLYYNISVNAYNSGRMEQAAQAKDSARTSARAIKDAAIRRKYLDRIAELDQYIKAQLQQ